MTINRERNSLQCRSIFQRRIQNPVEHLRWSFFVKTVNGQRPLTIFAKKLHRRYSSGFQIRLCNRFLSCDICEIFKSTYFKEQRLLLPLLPFKPKLILFKFIRISFFDKDIYNIGESIVLKMSSFIVIILHASSCSNLTCFFIIIIILSLFFQSFEGFY